ncbi:cryptochrome/photolyase family protein [Reinekea blandensis]|uniref:Deoxyribodipyrimidine photolyase-related protein n=1 Tax=Reinekea blandensis MED297 TaxID=314283 RepID=A4BEK4_9GAMM|nr:cryptochrome/photolyase family protein [Reinekea blandensis]EAR09431.1 hypothetical protein MED297_02387 [Reinekea sp. MED297] [Reinekea blandensis MED297]
MRSDQTTYKTLRLILGDQLNAHHSWFRRSDPEVLYVIIELSQELTVVQHHVQKVEAFFLAMQLFADALGKAGHQVRHLTLDDTQGDDSLDDCLSKLIRDHQVQRFEYQQPDEYRLEQQLRLFCEQQSIAHECVDSEHFFLNREALATLFNAGTSHRMEAFYRNMRRQFNVLMEGENPVGGQWNYDAENRKKLKAADLVDLPEPLVFANDVSEVRKRLARHHVRTIGESMPHCLWPVTRTQAKSLLSFFCAHCLPYFGRFQDAMTADAEESKRWSLYHSRLSFALNTKMLHPAQVIREAVNCYEQSDGQISLAQIEGFVRQILGWREFVRGMYWANMPQYGQLNALQAERDLPQQYWTGQTRMRCMSLAIGQSLSFAYAHHIQRLMVTGNFALLAGINPDQVDQWYLGIYVDAIEWVEMPNTRGMSQFADGGLVGSKAYAASGQYIQRMSDYCGGCYYRVREKTGPRACPLNPMYWHFMHRHQDAFQQNPRQALVYKNWRRFSKDEQQAILREGERCLSDIESL